MSPRGIPWVDEDDEAIATVLQLLTERSTDADSTTEEV